MAATRPRFATSPSKGGKGGRQKKTSSKTRGQKPIHPPIRFAMHMTNPDPTLEQIKALNTLESVYSLLVQLGKKMLHSAQADDWDHVEQLNALSEASIEKLQSMEKTHLITDLPTDVKQSIRSSIEEFLRLKDEVLSIAHPKMEELKDIILSSTRSKGFMGNTGYF